MSESGPAGGLPERIGVESNLLEFLPELGVVRARFRLLSLPKGDWLRVGVIPRVYDMEQVQPQGYLPPQPLAQGREVTTTATSEWNTVDLPPPKMRWGRYAVVAKVESRDDRYRKPLEPSLCYAGTVEYGDVLRLPKAMLEEVYAGTTGNPVAEETIRGLVRRGAVVAQDADGALLRARDDQGTLTLDLLAPPSQG